MRHSWPAASQRWRRSTTPAAASTCSLGCSVARPRSRHEAGSDPGQTAVRLLVWMDDDPVGFCFGLEKDLASVLDKAGLARAGAADAGAVGRGRPGWKGTRHSSPLLAVATGPTSARESTARHWTPCPSPRRSHSKAVSSSTRAASCGLTRARQPPRSTTTTTCVREFSPHPLPNALPAIPAWDSPIRAVTPTHTSVPARPERSANLQSDSRAAARSGAREARATATAQPQLPALWRRHLNLAQRPQDAHLLIPGRARAHQAWPTVIQTAPTRHRTRPTGPGLT
jgi:hypothetical protein